ncbi:MAG TPA: MotA/TolQ/ExbB proton channel family protein [Thermoanaerobaculia bacterium]|nr:MotA/TolQ/ExbB proton channel family protein [Thermoanaerobaculia bacterium]
MDMSLGHMWEQSGFIARTVIIILLAMLVWSFYVIFERFYFFRKAKQQSLIFAKQATQALAADKVQDAIESARKFPASHLARVTRAGLIQFLHEKQQAGLNEEETIEAARRAIERETLVTYSDFKKGTAGLATIASTAPFVGLFGTVFGIINAFTGMAQSGSGGIAAVSAGIAEALITTGLGIGVAIPAAWLFNHFTTILERFQVEMSNSASELIDFFIKKHQGSGHGAGAQR